MHARNYCGGRTTVNFHFMAFIIYHAFLKACKYLHVLLIYHLCNGGFSGGTTATTNKGAFGHRLCGKIVVAKE